MSYYGLITSSAAAQTKGKGLLSDPNETPKTLKRFKKADNFLLLDSLNIKQ